MVTEHSELIFCMMHDFLRIFCGLGLCGLLHLFYLSGGLGLFPGLIGPALGVGVGDQLLGSGGSLLHGGLCLCLSSNNLVHGIQSHGFTAFPGGSVGARGAIILMPGTGYFTAW